jgi:PAS domain-containing protein
MDGLPRHETLSDPDAIPKVVQDGYQEIGHLLDSVEESALLVDALIHDAPIIGASQGFEELTGHSRDHILGRNCRMLLEGVPDVAISRSSRKNIRDYLAMCTIHGLSDISEVTSLQPNCKKDGSTFVNFFMLGLVMVASHPYILSVHLHLGDGLFVRLRQSEMVEVMEAARAIFKKVRADMLWSLGFGEPPACMKLEGGLTPPFAFYKDRLQDHCLLLEGGLRAMRREPEELASNCMLFGDRPVQCKRGGLSFTVYVDSVTHSFMGLPVLGFTRRRPVDSPDLYPSVSRCLGASVLVGACGEGFARDKLEHFKIGFKQPPQDEVQTYALHPDAPPQKRTPPVQLQAGDVLRCAYTLSGRIILFHNGVAVLDFDTGRPVDRFSDYYAVCDICLTACSITIVPDKCDNPEEEVEDPDEREGSSWQASSWQEHTMDSAVKEALVNQGLKDAVAACCDFCVTIADPRAKDCPLIAVSEAFEQMTGYTWSEAVGVNCRFLNQGCGLDPMDLLNLRLSSQSGAPFTAVLTNRKKGGELFRNLIDLRGLTVATNPVTGEDLWFLIGIQADVTELDDQEIPEGHIAEMQRISDHIRKCLARELSEFAVRGAEALKKIGMPRLDGKSEESFKLLDAPVWRPGAELGKRGPADAPAKFSEMAYNRRKSPSAAACSSLGTSSRQHSTAEARPDCAPESARGREAQPPPHAQARRPTPPESRAERREEDMDVSERSVVCLLPLALGIGALAGATLLGLRAAHARR